MPDYQKLYIMLFQAITAALTHLQEQNYGTAAQTLMRAQQNAEEFYINAGFSDE